MSSKSPGLATPTQGAKLLLACHGLCVMGIGSMLLGLGLSTTGILNLVVRAELADVAAGLWAGLLTCLNGFLAFRLSGKPVVKASRLKLLAACSCVATLAQLVTLVVAAVAVFIQFYYLGDQMRYACDRDANECVGTVADPNYTGNNLNPNYNPNCAPDNPNCNVSPDDQLNYSPSCWYDTMQTEILRLYNYYNYIFRYSFACYAVQLLLCTELIALELCLLILVGYMLTQVNEKESSSKDHADSIAQGCVGSSIPFNNGHTAAVHGDSEEIYVNLAHRFVSAHASATALLSASQQINANPAYCVTPIQPINRSLPSLVSQTELQPNVHKAVKFNDS